MSSRKRIVTAGLAILSLSLLIHRSTAQQELPSALSGFDASELFDVGDDGQFSNSDEFMISLLMRSANASQESWERFADFNQGIGLQAIQADPQNFRFQVFELKGRVKSVWPIRLPERYEDSGLKGFYLVLGQSDTGEPWVIAARSVPRVWPVRTPLDEPIQCLGFFQAFVDFSSFSDATLETASGDLLGRAPLFVTDRLGWFPDRANSSLGVTESHALLAGKGVDIGQFEFVKKNNNRAIEESDSRCFFQLLAAAKHLKPDDFKGQWSSFVGLLENPKDHFGGAVQFTGHVKRAVRIYIDRKAVRERLGMDYYYELDMFVPLGNSRIVIKSRPRGGADGEAEDIEYANRFPATVCVPTLPGTPEEIRGKRVSIRGFFMKFWNYESEFTSRLHPSLGQISPLVVGVEPIINNSSKQAIDGILLTVIVLVVAGVVGLIWFFYRSDERQKNPLHGRLYDLQGDLDLPEMEADQRPSDEDVGGGEIDIHTD